VRGVNLLKSKDIFVKVYSPNSQLVEFSICLKNVPGALAEVSNLLASLGVNIYSGFLNFYPGEDKGRWAFIAELKGVGVSAEELVNRIKGLRNVLEVEYMHAKFDSLLIDVMHFPLLVMGLRSFIFKVDTWGSIAAHLLQRFGTGGAVILYEMGLKAGEARAKEVVTEGFSGSLAFDVILAERIGLGWGIPKLLEFNEKEVKGSLLVEELFECLPFKGKAKESRSHLFRGYLVGVIQHLFNKRVKVEEVECVAKGDQACLFKFG
jgi:predicted hydrocarbon binding protein